MWLFVSHLNEAAKMYKTWRLYKYFSVLNKKNAINNKKLIKFLSQ
ncbi:hypothetical protein UYSO10_4266 [Kosakonia radicincitans]|nr:hypothetical protein UYSO10_4266 [Kosakonia radicincitans]